MQLFTRLLNVTVDGWHVLYLLRRETEVKLALIPQLYSESSSSEALVSITGILTVEPEPCMHAHSYNNKNYIFTRTTHVHDFYYVRLWLGLRLGNYRIDSAIPFSHLVLIHSYILKAMHTIHT